MNEEEIVEEINVDSVESTKDWNAALDQAFTEEGDKQPESDGGEGPQPPLSGKFGLQPK